MPHLLVFAPCDRVITDQQDGSVSLISIITGADVTLGVDLPPDTWTPTVWFILALWRRTESDTGKAFEQRIDIESPSGRIFVSTPPSSFSMDARTHRYVVRLDRFPVGEEGDYHLNLYARELSSHDWELKSSFPLAVHRENPPEPQTQTNSSTEGERHEMPTENE